MDRANRLIVVLLLVTLAGLAAIVTVVAAGLWVPSQETFGQGLASLLGDLSAASAGVRVATGAAATGVFAATAITLVAELRPPGPTTYLVAATPAGDVTVTAQTLRDFVMYVVRGVPDVRSVSVRARMLEDGLYIRCWIDTNTSAVLVDLGEAVRDAVQERVTTQLGLTVARVETHVRMGPARPRRPVVK